jgi:hypothetical protein
MDWKQAQENCICKMCPSYFNCGEQIAYCMQDAAISKCIKTESGCICPGCPVWEEMHFQNNYYCIRGNEKLLTD